ncbi:DUF5906 domain-containing protein [Yoonia sp.]|uniref:DUF5906 domain-containing protein n=1 Tax=Yoonia sp. TaxID=2212373 RepID=UPI00358EB8AF
MTDTRPMGKAWEKAILECNWNIFIVLEPDEKGKKSKLPVSGHNIERPLAIEKAAKHTFAEAMVYVDSYKKKPKNIARANKWRKEYADAKGALYAGDIIEIRLGYCARPGSALIVVDLDDVLDAQGQLEDEWMDRLMAYEGYAEVSTGGRGLRLLMERQEGDEKRFASNVEIGGVGIFAKGGKGAALTFDRFEDAGSAIGRDDDLLDRLVEIRDAARAEKRKAYEGSKENAVDEVLHFGHWDVQQFVDTLEKTPNPADLDFNEWYGMIFAAKEHFSLREDVDLEAVAEALAAWSRRWEGQEGDPDDSKFWELWYRPQKDSLGRTTMGSWFELMKGVKGESKGEKAETERLERTIDGEPELDAPVSDVQKERDIWTRFVQVDAKFFDRLTRRFVTESQLLNHCKDVTLMDVDGGKPKEVKARAPRFVMILDMLAKFDEITFAPGRDEFIYDERMVAGRWIEREGWRALNSFVPLEKPQTTEEPTEWLQHVRELYPEDAELIFDWLALLVQRQGVPIGIAPILGGEMGCGKDLLLAPVEQYLGTYATAQPLDALDSQFNGWAERSLFVKLEEGVNSFDKRKQQHRAARLRSYVDAAKTSLSVEIKGCDREDRPNHVNFAATVNFLDAFLVEAQDRRLMVCWTDAPRLEGEKLERRVRGIAKEDGGKVPAWLLRRQIKHLEIGKPAPMTSGKRKAIEASLPPFMEEVRDYVERRDWVTIAQLTDHVITVNKGDDMNLKVRKSVGREVAECLVEGLGWKKPQFNKRTDGRVKVDGLYETIYTRGDKLPDLDLVREVVRSKDYKKQLCLKAV